ncbi:hypothetical protein E9228_003353 [Curtobacterium flaccumfaciens]|uniref:ABC-2 family transporter protein n=1 Tax=Curtobacterium salicis TaxID=1779862 RepID=A0ABX0TFK4_9MICO|nr:hypothetical protein [Curtobacterium sp. WW7]NII42679.1 hypothetical protein [Curtobacterium sp. WW7]
MSLRSQVALVAIAVVGALALGAGQVLVLAPAAAPAAVVRAAVSGAEVSPFFLGLAAALFTSADLSSRQFALTLLQMNDRTLVFIAKTAVLAASGVLTAIAVVMLLVPLALSRADGVLHVSPLAWLALPALHLLFVLLGAGLGMLMRSPVSAVFVYLAVVWALPLVVAIAGIWAPSISVSVLQFAPVTLTAAVLESATQGTAVLRFVGLDTALIIAGLVSVRRWGIR